MSVRPHPLQKNDPRYEQAWIIDYKTQDGKRRQEVFDGTLADALSVEQSLRIRTKRNRFISYPTLAEVSPLYIESYQVDHRPTGILRMHRCVTLKILPFFGRYQFQSITPQLVEAYKRRRLTDGVKPATINLELSFLSGLCKWAEEAGYCQEIKIKRFSKKLSKAPLMNPPTRREVVKVLRAIKRTKRPVFCAMYYLGLRTQEAKDLKPESVHWQHRVVIVRGKGNKERAIPINRKAAVYLRNSLPFYAPRSFVEILAFACKRSGVRYLNPHLFRHGFGMHAVAMGMPTRAVQAMLGHASITTTEIYTQMLAETLIKEMDKF
jgi:site-specific recombinase XerD